MFDLISEITQTIKNNKLRTFLTGIAVAWGVFMLIVLLGVARGVVNNYDEQMSNSSTNSIHLWSGTTSIPYKGYKEGRLINMKDDDMTDIINDVPAADKVMAIAGVTGAVVTGPKDYVSGDCDAVYPAEAENQHIENITGRFLNDRDIAELRHSIILSRKNAEMLFGNADSAIGKEVKLLDLSWKVVGIYEHRWRSTTFIPYTTYKAITGNNGYVGQMTVYVNGITTESEANEAETQVRKVMARNHDFDPEDKNAVWIWNQFANMLSQGKGMTYLNIAVWFIGILTLLTGIVGVSNIMFVSVRERVHEIGIRRAIGAKPRNIIIQILAESVVITTLFGYMGIVAGMGLLELLKPLLEGQAGFTNPTVDISIAVEVTVALIIAGGISGLFPAIKATKIKPVEALRDE